eukprot:TRINITY_DN5660_c0_g4_i1.p2 TRINITY_DN5660_c0_g4~~TRINITY_DN5660_c0_g4_i1.p2  ORF type:complete len:104 (+),score=3.50 TRINITY_DN5660_c0_g4_i1:1495-1806(+)
MTQLTHNAQFDSDPNAIRSTKGFFRSPDTFVISKVLSQLCQGWLHAFCFSILIYLEPNPVRPYKLQKHALWKINRKKASVPQMGLSVEQHHQLQGPKTIGAKI